MNVSHKYLLKSRQLTWENAQVIDNLSGPVPLEVKNQNWKEEYRTSHKNKRTNRCTKESFPTKRFSQPGYDETKEKIFVHLDYNKVNNVCVLLAPVDLNVSIKPTTCHESISLSEDDLSVVLSPMKRSPGFDKIKCAICHKTFPDKSNLAAHFRTHTGEKPFSCPQCEKKFSQKQHLKRHLLLHSGTREFLCDICHKAFTQKGNLTAHRRTPTGDKPFRCTKCNALFSRKSTLNTHMRTHTGETPYQCEICEKRFALLGSLKSHLLIHSDEKPFACTYASCDKTFRRKGDLQTHVRVHTKDKPYSCLKCRKTFSQSSSCRTHAKQCSLKKNVSSADFSIETSAK